MIKLYDGDIKFTFKCPIFKAQVRLGTCYDLYRKWQVATSVPVRKGCQACMASNKCPIWHLHQKTAIEDAKKVMIYEEKSGSLPKNILEKTSRVLIQESHMKFYDCSEKEISIMNAVNEATKAGKYIDIKADSVKLESIPEVQKKELSDSKSSKSDTLIKTDNYAEAINKITN